MATKEATRARGADEEPKPLLVQWFETVAAIMELNEGVTRLELEFDGGHLLGLYRLPRSLNPDERRALLAQPAIPLGSRCRARRRALERRLSVFGFDRATKR